MLSGVNDHPLHAHELGRLLQGHRDPVLNLIPWNPVYNMDDKGGSSEGGMKFAAPGADAVADFQRIVRGTYGVSCTVRQEKGQDISGACGQLVLEMAKPVPSATVLVGIDRLLMDDHGMGTETMRDIEDLAAR